MARTSRPAAFGSARPARSRDQLLLDGPGAFGPHRRLFGSLDLRVDLVTIVAVIADRRGDSADIHGEHLGGGDQSSRTALVDLPEELDDLPDIRSVGQGGAA